MQKNDEAQSPLDLIWGAGEIARIIGRSERATYEILEKGELPARKMNGRWVIVRSQLIASFMGDAR